jgi:ATP-binding protein involved in chromosome partitioning
MRAAETLIAQIDNVNASGGASNAQIQPTTPPGVSACSTAGAAAKPQHNHDHKSGGCGCN